MQATNFRFRFTKCILAALPLVSAGAVCRTSMAQAAPSATRDVSIDVFGAMSELKLDNGAGYKNYSNSFAFGADSTRRFRLLAVSIEPRFGRTSAATGGETESYFLGDVVLSRPISRNGRITPYGVAGVGYGKIQYGYNARQDNSKIYALGPGVQYNLTSRWAVRGDWQYQYWDVGTETRGFNPNGVTVAVVYRLHLGSSSGL